MNKEEMRKHFEENVEYLRRNIAPDDIYLFSEQTFMAALYFLHRFAGLADVDEECQKCEICRKYVSNILGFHKIKVLKIDGKLDLDMDCLDDDHD